MVPDLNSAEIIFADIFTNIQSLTSVVPSCQFYGAFKNIIGQWYQSYREAFEKIFFSEATLNFTDESINVKETIVTLAVTECFLTSTLVQGAVYLIDSIFSSIIIFNRNFLQDTL